jgi:hypothetical protein
MTDEGLNTCLNATDARFNAIDAGFLQVEERILEAMRNMQTELQRGMAAYFGSITLRVRKLAADQLSLDSGRVDILGKRRGEIEQSLGRA